MRVFCVCPANFATGGTELLHQLCQELSNNNVENYMLYQNANQTKTPTPNSFLKYDVKYVTSYVDAEDSILVLPETQIHMIDLCKKGKVVIWWLSVDNYLITYGAYIQNDIDLFHLKQRKNIIHFTQSTYAQWFLSNQMGIEESYSLKDYINEDIIRLSQVRGCEENRKNIGVYNPKKGYDAFKPIMEACGDWITWIPLQGMTPTEVAELLCQSKVYVDFGSHPGKDRIPREAAICGCCVITNRLGSAAFQNDVNIPEKYKIEDTSDVNSVVEKIKDLVANYFDRTSEYEDYRKSILEEQEGFKNDVKNAISILRSNLTISKSSFDASRHCEILDMMSQAENTMENLLLGAIKSCKNKDASGMVDNLLKVDYLLQIIRESIYDELSLLNEAEN